MSAHASKGEEIDEEEQVLYVLILKKDLLSSAIHRARDAREQHHVLLLCSTSSSNTTVMHPKNPTTRLLYHVSYIFTGGFIQKLILLLDAAAEKRIWFEEGSAYVTGSSTAS